MNIHSVFNSQSSYNFYRPLWCPIMYWNSRFTDCAMTISCQWNSQHYLINDINFSQRMWVVVSDGAEYWNPQRIGGNELCNTIKVLFTSGCTMNCKWPVFNCITNDNRRGMSKCLTSVSIHINPFPITARTPWVPLLTDLWVYINEYPSMELMDIIPQPCRNVNGIIQWPRLHQIVCSANPGF